MTQRRRILLVSNFFPPNIKGGGEVACAQLAGWLARQGHAVGVLTLAPPGAGDSNDETPEGYRVFRRRIPNVYHTHQHDRAPGWKKPLWHLLDHRNPFSHRALAGVLEEFQPEVVNTHNLQGMGYNLWALLGESGLPVLATLHDPALVCIRSSMFKRGESCRELCTACGYSKMIKGGYLGEIARLSFASPSQALLTLLRPYLPKNTVAARHVPNPLHFPAASPESREPGKIELLYVGQISAHKGVEFLIEAMDQMDGNERFRLTLLGRGPLLESLREKYSTRSWIRFEGFVPTEKVGGYMAASDVLLIPSLWVENAPLVAMEAIGLGLPMLTSDRGGLPELVVHGVTGLTLEAGNTAKWIETLSSLASDPQLLAAWKANALQRRGEFAIDVLGRRYLDLLEYTIHPTASP